MTLPELQRSSARLVLVITSSSPRSPMPLEPRLSSPRSKQFSPQDVMPKPTMLGGRARMNQGLVSTHFSVLRRISAALKENGEDLSWKLHILPSRFQCAAWERNISHLFTRRFLSHWPSTFAGRQRQAFHPPFSKNHAKLTEKETCSCLN